MTSVHSFGVNIGDWSTHMPEPNVCGGLGGQTEGMCFGTPVYSLAKTIFIR